ncbi:ABC transporter permease [Corynebacterium freneyi]
MIRPTLFTGPAAPRARGPRRTYAWALVLIWCAVLACAIAGPLIAGLLGAPDPGEPVGRPFDEPQPGHPLGTDRLGRDLLARMLMGNAALVIPPAIAALASTAAGLAVGLASAALPRWRPVFRWVTETLLVIPAMVILLAVIAATGGNIAAVAAMAVLVSLPMSAKYLDAAARPVLSSGYVEISHATGASWPSIIVRDVLPAMRRPILADAGIRYVAVVFMTATASFLGGASGSGGETWAAMVGAGISGIDLNPWSVVAPVAAIIALTAPPALLTDLATGGRR